MCLGRRLNVTGERMLCHTDRRQIEADSRVAGDAEQRGVQSPVSIDHEHIGSPGEPSDCRLDSRELSIGEVRRDVWEIHPPSDEGDFNRLEISESDGNGGRIHLIPLVAYIDAADDLDRSGSVPLDDPGSESPLFSTKESEEFDAGQRGDNPGSIDATSGEVEAFSLKAPPGLCEDGPTVGADDAVAFRRVRMINKPGCDGTCGSYVAEGEGDRTARRHSPARNFGEAFRYGLREVRVHGLTSSPARKTFLRNGPSTDLRLLSSSAAA